MQQEIVARNRLLAEIEVRCAEAPAVVLLGARQVGKTTLGQIFASRTPKTTWYDLESVAGFESLRPMPEKTLGGLQGLVVLDEIQRMPELFRILRPLCDRTGRPASFLLLGSASPALMRGASESLAGRAQFLQIHGLTLDEVGSASLERLWMRGGFPRSYIAAEEGAARRWREGFVQAILERDIPQLGIRVPAMTLRRFWSMAAHYHGQVLNVAELARALGVTPATGRHYLDILCGAFLMRQLPPWHENLGKRQVKSPKLYFRDSGLLHLFLGVEEMTALLAHPRLGASWEGFAIEQVLALVGEQDAYFWGTQRGAELDLLVLRRGRRYGFEMKASEAPRLTPSMRIALEDLKLERLWVLHPGNAPAYELHERVMACSLPQWMREHTDLPATSIGAQEGANNAG